MSSLPNFLTTPPAPLVTFLPGSDRKRTAAPYQYRIRYLNPQADAAGCVMIWEVSGGRSIYQVALERTDAGTLRLHCTCADAVFRGDDQGHFCKHIHGLLKLSEPSHPVPRVGA
jgi:hypothetical protein